MARLFFVSGLAAAAHGSPALTVWLWVLALGCLVAWLLLGARRFWL